MAILAMGVQTPEEPVPVVVSSSMPAGAYHPTVHHAIGSATSSLKAQECSTAKTLPVLSPTSERRNTGQVRRKGLPYKTVPVLLRTALVVFQGGLRAYSRPAALCGYGGAHPYQCKASMEAV